jgi:hypothetical protein
MGKLWSNASTKKRKRKERKESDAPTQTIIAMRAPLAKVLAVDDDDELVVVLA